MDDYFKGCNTIDELEKEQRWLELSSEYKDPIVKQHIKEQYEVALQRIKKERRSRILISLGLVGASVALPAMLGAIFAAIGVGSSDRTYWQGFIHWFGTMYLLFGAGFTISAFLMMLMDIDSELSLGFGYGLFFGTALPGVAICKYLERDHFIIYALTFTISALVCYIVWLKKKKK